MEGRLFSVTVQKRMPLCTEKQARAAAHILTRNVHIQDYSSASTDFLS